MHFLVFNKFRAISVTILPASVASKKKSTIFPLFRLQTTNMFSIVGDGFKTLFLQMHCQIGGGGPRLGPNSDVAAYRDFVLQNQALIDVPERGKCNRWASELRQEGNRLFLSRKFDDALAKFNESICAAEPGSEHLGMGFANR